MASAVGGRIQFTAWLSDVRGTDSIFRVLVDLCMSEKLEAVEQINTAL